MKSFPSTIYSMLVFAFAVLVTSFVNSGSIAAQQASQQSGTRPVFDEKFEHWPLETKINGRVFVNRNLSNHKLLDRMLQRIIRDGSVTLSASSDDSLGKHLFQFAQSLDIDSDQEPKPLAIDELKSALQHGGLVYVADIKSRAESLLKLRSEFKEHIQSGGTLIFDFRYAHLLGSFVANLPNTEGLNLLPDCLIVSDFDKSGNAKEQLAKQLKTAQPAVGIGIEDHTMLLLAGRSLLAFGSGSATIAVANGDRQAEFAQLSMASGSQLQGHSSYLDLTQWRRMAIDRTLAAFPPKKPRTPFLENGTLYIVGGGGMPRGLMSEMIEKAGGPEHAKLVYVPCSESDNIGERQGTVEMWKQMGVKHATFIHTKDRNRANNDEKFLEPLKDATMLWFGGGRQWNFADSYYGTKAHRLMKEVLHRGGVIGGSSAGASIQARFLARATPIGNTSILAPGYERGGLGFLSGVAIDQHFSERGRQKDMTQLVEKYPQMLGIGIDEATAIVVEKSRAKVIGRGKVYFYDRSKTAQADAEDYVALSEGEVFDLETRTVVESD